MSGLEKECRFEWERQNEDNGLLTITHLPTGRRLAQTIGAKEDLPLEDMIRKLEEVLA